LILWILTYILDVMNDIPFSNSNIVLTESEKNKRITKASEHFGKFMNVLGFDFRNDPNSIDTPRRVAKAIVNDICSGCFTPPPNITAFDNVDQYDGIVCQNNIKMTSICAHHWLPFTGTAHVAYIPSKTGKVIGLSKLNRIVDWFARRPQVQENLTIQIHNFVNDVCKDNQGVAVMIEANHTCCALRGIKHDSSMRTAKMSGAFLDNNDNSRSEFYKFVEFSKDK
jgi:GTP cyclohydrolase I